ncbi:CBS domain-containing protein [Hyella patelloides LEGE 07179]|uniref:CBS domain-containing protein n=1 Tax=Hyella patelloides LEGE 07179 TaxID=945734 RepID=A0A563VNL5_9CYAN|nr:hemolysin family protein [Hyella patelloides]VEP12957.1 CBS domain-containing protein [Hyella patelloides LEGE 07179]
MTGQNFLLLCLGLFCLIAINAFFTAAEFSIVSVRRSRISQLVKSGDVQAQTVQSLQKGIERLLSTTQLGITLSSLALGWIGESTIAVIIARLIEDLPLPETMVKSLSHSLAIPIAFVCLVYLQIVLGELVPKSVALLYPEKLARFFAPPSLVIASIFRPFLEILNSSTRSLLKLCGIRYTAQGWYEQLTAQELQLIIATEKESTGLEAKQRELLNNILKFGEVTAVEAMIPRTQIQFLSQEATFAELLQKIATEGYFRYPIIGKSLDEIQGIIDYKSLAIPLAEGTLVNDLVITPWIQPVKFVSESTPLKELLSLMQQDRQAMVIVIDDFGGTSGLITLQDLITEIIGNQDNPTFPITKSFKKIDRNTFIVSAQMNIEDVNEGLKIDLPSADDYHTLNGFLQEKWQKIPVQGEILDYNNLQFTVITTENNRLQQIKIKRKESYDQNTSSGNYVANHNIDSTNKCSNS